MPVQTTYEAERPAGFEGQRATLDVVSIISKAAEGSDIAFGRAVVRGTADDQAQLPSIAGEDFLGITEMTTAWSQDENDLHQYDENREMNIMRMGEIWVYTEVAVVPGDPVFFRHTANTAPLDVIGRFRKDADTARADQIPGATFETTAGAGELAKVQLTGQK